MVNPNLLEKEIHLILLINTSGAWDPDPELGETLNQYLNDGVFWHPIAEITDLRFIVLG